MNYFKQHGSHMIKLSCAFVGTTVLVLWGWNNSIAYLFGLPMMKFKQATGLMVLTGSITFFLGGGRARPGNFESPVNHDSLSEKE